MRQLRERIAAWTSRGIGDERPITFVGDGHQEISAMTVTQAKVSVPSRLPFFNFFDHQYRQSFGIRVTSGPAAFIATLPAQIDRFA